MTAKATRSTATEAAATTPAADEPLDLGPLPGYLGFALRRAQIASFRNLDQRAGELGLTPGQFSLLAILAANPGVGQKTVSRELGVDASTLSRALQALAGRGLVARVRAARDRRNHALSLTAAGRDALAAMRARVEAQEALMAAALDPDERALAMDLLRRLGAALDRDTAAESAGKPGESLT